MVDVAIILKARDICNTAGVGRDAWELAIRNYKPGQRNTDSMIFPRPMDEDMGEHFTASSAH